MMSFGHDAAFRRRRIVDAETTLNQAVLHRDPMAEPPPEFPRVCPTCMSGSFFASM